jgi:hypothetical protein
MLKKSPKKAGFTHPGAAASPKNRGFSDVVRETRD